MGNRENSAARLTILFIRDWDAFQAAMRFLRLAGAQDPVTIPRSTPIGRRSRGLPGKR